MIKNIKKIIRICMELDKDGLYSQADRVFNKFSQNINSVATPTQDTASISAAYTKLQSAGQQAPKIAQDIFSTLAQLRPEKINQFIVAAGDDKDIKSIVDTFTLYCQQWSSQSAYPVNKIIASSINSQLKSRYIEPIFNNYYKKYPKIAILLGYIVLSLLMHPVDADAYQQSTIFLELFDQNIANMNKPSQQFVDASTYAVNNTTACITALENEAMKKLIESYTEGNIVTQFLTSQDSYYKVLNDIVRLFFKSAPFLSLVMDSEDIANIQTDNTQSDASAPQNQACSNALQSVGSIDASIYDMLMQICNVIKTGDPNNYPKFNQDLIDCGYAQGTPTAGIGSQGSTNTICPKALQWLADLYNSVPDDSPTYKQAIYDPNAASSVMGIITSDALTQFLNTGISADTSVSEDTDN